jgi:hypothetical protein
MNDGQICRFSREIIQIGTQSSCPVQVPFMPNGTGLLDTSSAAGSVAVRVKGTTAAAKVVAGTKRSARASELRNPAGAFFIRHFISQM